jgi:2,3-bisphosphoglycerate-dependent phosphoglycerate mutase
MIPLSESLKDVVKRTSVFWDDVIVPQLRNKQRLMIVGHENNLRSLIKRLDDISDKDIINVELPRAIPLVYDLDPETLKPIKTAESIVCNNPEGLLTGRYLCTPEELKVLAERDQKQVYDVQCTENLELVSGFVIYIFRRLMLLTPVCCFTTIFSPRRRL